MRTRTPIFTTGLLLLYTLALAAPTSATAQGCPNEALRTGPSANLPDCRAYEMVSPAYKAGSAVGTPEGVSQDGLRLLVFSRGSFSDPEDVEPLGQQYEIIRDPAKGWMATPLDAPFSEFPAYSTIAATSDFQSTLVVADTPTEHVNREGDVYLGPPGGLMKPLGPLASSVAAESELTFIDASADLHHALFYIHTPNVGSEEPDPVWPGDTTAAGFLPSLYEYEYLSEKVGEHKLEPRLVGISNVGIPGSVGEDHLISNCGISLGSDSRGRGDEYNAVSVSGATVFFTAGALTASCKGGSGAVGPPVNELYARVAGVPGVPAHTVAISEPSEEDCSSCYENKELISNGHLGNAVFAGASEDGSKVFFLTSQPLQGGDSTQNLYEYDFNAPSGRKVTRVSVSLAGGADVQGVARMSEDGSHVYLVAKGVLAGTNGEHKAPVEGEDNLYVYDTSTRRIRFVATLSGKDEADWSPVDERPAQATPDGRFLVFQSIADLTADEEGREEAGQVFEYDADTETLVRISRSDSGYNEDGNSKEYAATIPIQGYARESTGKIGHFTGLALSSDGSRVFFSSEDALTRQASNGILNVYEYHGGQVGLISDGHDAAELSGTDESGLDVFFSTAGALVGQDTDDQIDLYDARIGGGFVAQVASAPCVGDACQNPSGAALTLATPATTSVQGESPPPAPHVSARAAKAESLTRRQKLSRALRACGRRPKRSRVSCEKKARRAYGRTK